VVDIRVDEKVKTAMNEINAAKRLREVSLFVLVERGNDNVLFHFFLSL